MLYVNHIVPIRQVACNIFLEDLLKGYVVLIFAMCSDISLALFVYPLTQFKESLQKYLKCSFFKN